MSRTITSLLQSVHYPFIWSHIIQECVATFKPEEQQALINILSSSLWGPYVKEVYLLSIHYHLIDPESWSSSLRSAFNALPDKKVVTRLTHQEGIWKENRMRGGLDLSIFAGIQQPLWTSDGDKNITLLKVTKEDGQSHVGEYDWRLYSSEQDYNFILHTIIAPYLWEHSITYSFPFSTHSDYCPASHLPPPLSHLNKDVYWDAICNFPLLSSFPSMNEDDSEGIILQLLHALFHFMRHPDGGPVMPVWSHLTVAPSSSLYWRATLGGKMIERIIHFDIRIPLLQPVDEWNCPRLVDQAIRFFKLRSSPTLTALRREENIETWCLALSGITTLKQNCEKRMYF